MASSRSSRRARRARRSGPGRSPLLPAARYDKDKFENTAWTVNGKIGDLKADVHRGVPGAQPLDQTNDYTNYARSNGGYYYSCTGGGRDRQRRSRRPSADAGGVLFTDQFLARHGAQHAFEPRAALQHAGWLLAYTKIFGASTGKTSKFRTLMNFLYKTVSRPAIHVEPRQCAHNKVASGMRRRPARLHRASTRATDPGINATTTRHSERMRNAGTSRRRSSVPLTLTFFRRC